MDRPPSDPPPDDASGDGAVPARPVRPKAVKPAPVKPKAVKPPPAAPRPVQTGPSSPRPRRARRSGRRRRRVGPAKAAPTPAPRPPPAAAEAPAASAAPVAPDDPMIGKKIGRCTIEGLVGVGKTARVYRAHYEALDDTVAIKILRRGVSHEPVLVERFDTEARSIAKVDNENVLKIYDVGREDDRHFMVVELLEGEEILDLIGREGQVELMDALRIVRQAANGLSAAHAYGLVHRDIKPQNLFLLEDGTVKVVDFGLAARFEDHSERVGTPHYMAPEVCESGNAEPASDIYSLGIVLHHLLVGQPPYAGQPVQGILRSHMAGKPLHPERERRGLPKEVADLVRRLTKRDPLVRPTAAELIAELDKIGGEALEQKDTLRRRRYRSRARSAVARRERAGRRAPALTAMIVVLAIVAVVVGIIVAGDRKPPPKDEVADEPSPVEVRAPDPVVEPEPPDEPAVPIESEEEKQARLARLEVARIEKEAALALERAKQFAREKWHSLEDNEAVRLTYVSVYERYRSTKAGREARRIARGIKNKSVHPHPDKEWSDEDAIQAARERWSQVKPQIEAAIAKHDYTAARDLMPAPLSGLTKTAAKFTGELDFWREHTGLLQEFQRELPKAVMALPEDQRRIETPSGQRTVKRVNAASFEVTIEFTTRSYAWRELEPATIADLAQRAFTDKGARHLLLLTAFTYAHLLKDQFFDAQLWMGATTGARAHEHIMKEYADRFESRVKRGG